MNFIYCALVLILALALVAYGLSCKNMKSSSKEDQKKMQNIGNNFMLAGGILIVVGIPLILFLNMEKSSNVDSRKKLVGGGNENLDKYTLTPKEQEMFLSNFKMHPLRL